MCSCCRRHRSRCWSACARRSPAPRCRRPSSRCSRRERRAERSACRRESRRSRTARPGCRRHRKRSPWPTSSPVANAFALGAVTDVVGAVLSTTTVAESDPVLLAAVTDRRLERMRAVRRRGRVPRRGDRSPVELVGDGRRPDGARARHGDRRRAADERPRRRRGQLNSRIRRSDVHADGLGELWNEERDQSIASTVSVWSPCGQRARVPGDHVLVRAHGWSVRDAVRLPVHVQPDRVDATVGRRVTVTWTMPCSECAPSFGLEIET